MNKKFLSLAVASAMAAPMAAQAQDVTIYGHVAAALSSYDVDQGGDNNGNDYWDIASHQSRFGIKGSEDLGNGMKAIFKMEFQVSIADQTGSVINNETNDTLQNMRNSYVGLSSDWGTVLMGIHDTPYKMSTGKLDVFAGQLGDYNNNGTAGSAPGAEIGFADIRADNALAYVSPNMNGLTIAAAIVTPGSATAATSAAAAASTDANDLAEAVSLAAMYSNGPFYASLAFEDLSDDIMGPANNNGQEKWRLGLGYSANNFTVGFAYEDQEIGGNNNDIERWMLNGTYTFGNNKAKIQYMELDSEAANADVTKWAIGLDHMLSKRTKVYAVYADSDSSLQGAASTDWSGFSVGMATNF